eukprot:6209036-Pleurochrysis_carterae.AAC.3
MQLTGRASFAPLLQGLSLDAKGSSVKPSSALKHMHDALGIKGELIKKGNASTRMNNQSRQMSRQTKGTARYET